MNVKKIQSVNALSDDERLDYFIRKVADFEGLWGAYENGWSMLGSGTHEKVIPFWPEEDLVQAYIESNRLPVSPKKIELEHFLDKWVTGMERDGTKICVSPVLEGKGVVIEPARLADMIRDEMAQYE